MTLFREGQRLMSRTDEFEVPLWVIIKAAFCFVTVGIILVFSMAAMVAYAADWMMNRT